MLPSINKIRQRTIISDKSFDSVVQRCGEQIRNTPPNVTYTIFKVPAVLPEVPLYNFHKCIVHLQTELTRQGYSVTIGRPRTLYIEWAQTTPDPKRIESVLRSKFPNVNFDIIEGA